MCGIAGIAGKSDPGLLNKIPLPKGSKILVVNIAGIGDQIMAIPAMDALRALYPACELSLLTIARCKGLLNEISYLKHIYEIGLSYEKTLSYLRWANIKLLQEIRHEHFSLAINLESISSLPGSLKMWFLLSLIGATHWAGRNTAGRGNFYDIAVSENDIENRHTVEIMMAVMEELGAPHSGDIRLRLPINNDDRETAASFLARHTVSPSSVLIGFNPGSFRPSRRWSLDRWSALANRLQEDDRIEIFISGGPDEKGMIGTIAAGMRKKPITAFEQLSLRHVPALISACRVFVTNDTGPMHIAAAVGTPLVALFGPGDRARYRPYTTPGKAEIIQKPVNCQLPCYRHECASADCMKHIQVEDVLSAVREQLKRTP
jgi:lipopolysaccharide heptosyltransferase II